MNRLLTFFNIILLFMLLESCSSIMFQYLNEENKVEEDKIINKINKN